MIPEPVQGAAVLFTTGFVMRSGIAMLTQRMIDNRRAIVIGFSLLVGLSFNDILTALNVWPPIHAIFSTPLVASVSAAILLTALFRIGLKTTVSTVWSADQGAAPLKEWMQAWSGGWAARCGPARNGCEQAVCMGRRGHSVTAVTSPAPGASCPSKVAMWLCVCALPVQRAARCADQSRCSRSGEVTASRPRPGMSSSQM